MGEYEVAGYGVRSEHDQPYASEANFDPKVKFAFGGNPELQAEHQAENPEHFLGADQKVAQLKDGIVKAEQEIASLTVEQKPLGDEPDTELEFPEDETEFVNLDDLKDEDEK